MKKILILLITVLVSIQANSQYKILLRVPHDGPEIQVNYEPYYFDSQIHPSVKIGQNEYLTDTVSITMIADAYELTRRYVTTPKRSSWRIMSLEDWEEFFQEIKNKGNLNFQTLEELSIEVSTQYLAKSGKKYYSIMYNKRKILYKYIGKDLPDPTLLKYKIKLIKINEY